MLARFVPAMALGAMAFSCSASDVIRPNDPSQKLEVLINQGLMTAQTNFSPSAPFADKVFAARSMFLRHGVWTSKSTLTVCFWNGSRAEQVAVAESAKRWNQKARLQLSLYQAPNVLRRCANADSADIRIALSSVGVDALYEEGQDPRGNWSLIGKQSTYVPLGKPATARYAITMNLPHVNDWLKSGNQDQLDFDVGHEFGHAFGLLHEFQAGVCSDWIDINKFAADQGWPPPMIASELAPLPSLVGTRFALDYDTKGGYDADSIMQYNFPDQYYIARPPQPNPCRRTRDVKSPSPGDIKTLIAMYGSYSALSGVFDKAAKWKTFPPAVLNIRESLQAARAAATVRDPGSVVKFDRIIEAAKRLEQFEQGIVVP